MIDLLPHYPEPGFSSTEAASLELRAHLNGFLKALPDYWNKRRQYDLNYQTWSEQEFIND